MEYKVWVLCFVLTFVFLTNAAVPVCNGPNEHSGCGKPCDVDCNYLYREDPSCKSNNKRCMLRCYCNEGYARERGICVPIDKC
ncbi:hypothetical protein Trydic_g12752 [Trypoxylus dichotomus]